MDVVTLALGGRERELRLTLRSFRRIEAQLKADLGLTIAKAMQQADPEHPEENALTAWMQSMDGVSLVLWAALLHAEPELTRDQVDDWVDVGNLEQVSEAIGRCWTASMPERDASPNGTGPLAAAGATSPIGSSSGP